MILSAQRRIDNGVIRLLEQLLERWRDPSAIAAERRKKISGGTFAGGLKFAADELDALLPALGGGTLQQLYDGITFATYHQTIDVDGCFRVVCRLCAKGHGEPHAADCGVGKFESALLALGGPQERAVSVAAVGQ